MFSKKNIFLTIFSCLVITNYSIGFVSLDAAEPWQLGFQDPATPIMEGIVKLHNEVMLFLCVTSGVVFWLLGRSLFLFSAIHTDLIFDSMEKIETLKKSYKRLWYKIFILLFNIAK